MKRTPIGQANLAALIGGSLGAITGLFAVGVAPACIEGNARLLIAHPTIGLFCFFLSGLFGWLVGGQVGPWLKRRRSLAYAHVVGGVIAGLLPFAFFIWLGWYLWTH